MVDQNSSQAFTLGFNMGMHAIATDQSIMAPDRIRDDAEELTLFNKGVKTAYTVYNATRL